MKIYIQLKAFNHKHHQRISLLCLLDSGQGSSLCLPLLDMKIKLNFFLYFFTAKTHLFSFFIDVCSYNERKRKFSIFTFKFNKKYRVRKIPFFWKMLKKTTEYFLKLLFLFESTILPFNNGK